MDVFSCYIQLVILLHVKYCSPHSLTIDPKIISSLHKQQTQRSVYKIRCLGLKETLEVI